MGLASSTKGRQIPSLIWPLPRVGWNEVLPSHQVLCPRVDLESRVKKKEFPGDLSQQRRDVRFHREVWFVVEFDFWVEARVWNRLAVRERVSRLHVPRHVGVE